MPCHCLYLSHYRFRIFLVCFPPCDYYIITLRSHFYIRRSELLVLLQLALPVNVKPSSLDDLNTFSSSKLLDHLAAKFIPIVISSLVLCGWYRLGLNIICNVCLHLKLSHYSRCPKIFWFCCRVYN